ncbi:heterokaryon incompatibility protein-domain-containing protein [Trametes meyenii]|nr:heterokaryon incompatibility protein-domain-containing protein [Trametes meyenii]
MPLRLFSASSEQISLQTFDSPEIVPFGYAILSHVWGKTEQSYRDIVALSRCGGTYEDPSLSEKICKCYKLATDQGFRWFWIDAPCIDKRNSTELNEALSSMFDWYAKAEVCFAHLPDVPSDDNIHEADSAFRRSVYFTRGWTLQELVAPGRVVFLAQDWTIIGEKEALAGLLEEITGIDADVLTFRRPLTTVSVARRFSWASRRSTRRLEDEAYCLMGLFGVRIQMDYGEGSNAFVRLQKRILAEVYDHTLFSWGRVQDMHLPHHGYLNPDGVGGQPVATTSLFASSPAAFAASSAMSPVDVEDFVSTMKGWRIIKRRTTKSLPRFVFDHHGLECRLPVICRGSTPVAALIACQEDAESYIALPLKPKGSQKLLYTIHSGTENILGETVAVLSESDVPRLLRMQLSKFLKPSLPWGGLTRYYVENVVLTVSFRKIQIVTGTSSRASSVYSKLSGSSGSRTPSIYSIPSVRIAPSVRSFSLAPVPPSIRTHPSVRFAPGTHSSLFVQSPTSADGATLEGDGSSYIGNGSCNANTSPPMSVYSLSQDVLANTRTSDSDQFPETVNGRFSRIRSAFRLCC